MGDLAAALGGETDQLAKHSIIFALGNAKVMDKSIEAAILKVIEGRDDVALKLFAVYALWSCGASMLHVEDALRFIIRVDGERDASARTAATMMLDQLRVDRRDVDADRRSD